MKKLHIIVLVFALLLIAAPLTAQSFKALCVGINDYADDDFDRLYAEDDADDISDALINDLGWNSGDVVLRTGINGTYHYIHTPLRTWSATTSNTILFSFSGHGESTEAGNNWEGLVSKDQYFINASNFLGYLDEGSSSYEKFAFIIDAPYSGFLADDMDRGVILTACSTSETAVEESEYGHGVFSKYIIDGIEDMDADNSGDGRVSAEEIFDYADDGVDGDEYTSQTPQFADSDTGNNLNLTPLPAIPDSLYITGSYWEAPMLHWNASAGASKYMIYRKLYYSETWYLIDSTMSLTYEDTEFELCIPPYQYYYSYAVKAKNAYGESALSNIKSVWITVPPKLGLSDNEIIVDEFGLDQNYPNPFNPETTIEFRLKEARHVSLTVYDITGKVVAELVNGQKPAGNYSVTWNASNVASGLYIYRISAGSYTEIKRMVVVK